MKDTELKVEDTINQELDLKTPPRKLNEKEALYWEAWKVLGIDKNLNAQQKITFLGLCVLHELNPLKKEIYPVLYKNKDNTYNLTPTVAYTTYIQRAEKSGLLEYYDIVWSNLDPSTPNSELYVTVIIKRIDRTREQHFTVWMKEYHLGSPIWTEKPRTMLEKCGLASAFRKCFSVELSGMPYTSEEYWKQSKENDKNITKSADIDLTKTNKVNNG